MRWEIATSIALSLILDYLAMFYIWECPVKFNLRVVSGSRIERMFSLQISLHLVDLFVVRQIAQRPFSIVSHGH